MEEGEGMEEDGGDGGGEGDGGGVCRRGEGV